MVVNSGVTLGYTGSKGSPSAPDGAEEGEPGVALGAASAAQPLQDVRVRGRNSHQRVGRRTGLADHHDVVLHREQFVNTAADHLMVIEKKYSDFSLFAHGVGVTRDLSDRPGGTLPVPGVTGITCRCSGPLQGCNQCCDQRLFPTRAK
jgi:hypothetical protein